MLRNNVVEKVLKLLNRREKWLVVAAVRFLRTCIGLKDDFYNRYLVRLPLPLCVDSCHALPQTAVLAVAMMAGHSSQIELCREGM